jgi:hypothetical protein
MLYVWRALAGLLMALPAAVFFGGTTSGYPRGQAEIFDPGGVMLLETLRFARRGVLGIGASATALALVALALAVFPLVALLAGLGRDGRLTAGLLADRAARHAGTIALVTVAGAAAQGVVLALVLVVGAKITGALALAGPKDDLATAIVLVVALTLAAAIGVVRDLASVAAVRADKRFYVATSHALAIARRHLGRAFATWALSAVAAVALVVLAAVAAPPAARSTRPALLLAVILHQGAIFGACFAHAAWLAAAMRLYDEAMPQAPEAMAPAQDTTEP